MGTPKGAERGSYGCGRCKVPKKGHVCPYKMGKKFYKPVSQRTDAKKEDKSFQVNEEDFMNLDKMGGWVMYVSSGGATNRKRSQEKAKKKVETPCVAEDVKPTPSSLRGKKRKRNKSS